jgi:hypothetical protein
MNSKARHHLRESAVGSGVVLLAVASALIGMAAHVTSVTDPDPWFATAISLGIVAAAVAVDEKRMVHSSPETRIERLTARWVIAAALAITGAGLAVGLVQDPDTNPWADVGVTVALIALAAALESHRLATKGWRQVPFHQKADIISGRSAALAAFLLATVGVAASYLHADQAEAWLFASVVFGVLAVAFVLDEQLELIHEAGDSSPQGRLE